MDNVIKTHGYEAAFIPEKEGKRDALLSVTRRNKGGRYLVGADAVTWWHAIQTAIDAKEQAALCQAIYMRC